MEKSKEELYLKLSHIPKNITSNFLRKEKIKEQDFEDLQQELNLALIDLISRGLINEKNKHQTVSRLTRVAERSIYLRKNSLGWNGNVKGIKKNEKKLTVEKQEVQEISLDNIKNEDDDNLCEEYILNSLTLYCLQKTIEDVINTLTLKEKYILTRRFGLDGDEEKTLYEVGQELETYGEAIRRREAKALRKLRHPSRSKKLRKYL